MGESSLDPVLLVESGKEGELTRSYEDVQDHISAFNAKRHYIEGLQAKTHLQIEQAFFYQAPDTMTLDRLIALASRFENVQTGQGLRRLTF